MTGQLHTDKTAPETRREIELEFDKWPEIEDWRIPRPKGASQRADVGFWIDGEKHEFGCDRFHNYAINLRAVYLILRPMRLAANRGILKEMARAVAGFLTAPEQGPVSRPWYEVLGVTPATPDNVVKAAHKALAQDAHPDKGGSNEEMAEINAALEEYEVERG